MGRQWTAEQRAARSRAASVKACKWCRGPVSPRNPFYPFCMDECRARRREAERCEDTLARYVVHGLRIRPQGIEVLR